MMLPKPLFKCNANCSTLPYRSLTSQEAEATMEHHIQHSSLSCLSPQRGVETAAPRLQATLLYLDHLNTILYTSPAWLCLALWQAVRKVIGEGRKEAKNTVSVWIPRSQERDSRTQAKYEFPTGNPGILIDLRYREIMTLFNLVCTRVRETFANRVHLTSAVCGTHT